MFVLHLKTSQVLCAALAQGEQMKYARGSLKFITKESRGAFLQLSYRAFGKLTRFFCFTPSLSRGKCLVYIQRCALCVSLCPSKGDSASSNAPADFLSESERSPPPLNGGVVSLNKLRRQHAYI